MNMVRCFLTGVILVFFHTLSWCQQKVPVPAAATGKDSTIHLQAGKQSQKIDNPYQVDSATRRKHNPRKATLYSTFCPGLGQIYNRKYWKVPIVYAAIGIPAYLYFDNKNWVHKCQYALAVILSPNPSQDSLNKVDPALRPFVNAKDDNSIRTARNSYRQNEDYSVLFFLLFWGLNIVDATVDAHLMDFDVSNQLSLHLQPGPSSPGNATAMSASMSNMTGISLLIDIHKPKFKPIPLP